MKKIDLSQSGALGNILHRIDKEWLLLNAGTPERHNTMTVRWNNFGILWHRPMATIYVRPERYTYEFTEAEDYFSLAFFAPEHRESLIFCGKESGRDHDKTANCGFTIAAGTEGGVYYKEADLALICKKRYRVPLELDNMIDIDPTLYYGGKHGGVHVMYMGEIVEVFTKEG